jgi:DNA-binding MarR family transcriptional regulator
MTVVVDVDRLEKKRKQAIRLRAVVDRHRYFEGVAEARYVLRKVFRIIEEHAKLAGLDPLEHQAMIQIYGSPLMQLRIKDVAERLDIAPAFASNVLKSLQKKGHIARVRSDGDQRVTLVAVTRKGVALLHHIDEQVQVHVDYFTHRLSAQDRETALSIMMFYIGISLGERGIAKSRKSSMR